MGTEDMKLRTTKSACFSFFFLVALGIFQLSLEVTRKRRSYAGYIVEELTTDESNELMILNFMQVT